MTIRIRDTDELEKWLLDIITAQFSKGFYPAVLIDIILKLTKTAVEAKSVVLKYQTGVTPTEELKQLEHALSVLENS
jgi:hypothetical protein